MEQKRLVCLALAIMWVASLLACGGPTVKIGWSARERPGHVTHRYRTFRGRETWRFSAKEGQRITLDYDATVYEGSMIVQVGGPERGTLWDVTLSGPGSNYLLIAAPSSAPHPQVAKGTDTGGGRDVGWQMAGQELV